MINIIKIKHSIKQILIASLCAVSALTFGGDGNLRQPLLAAPGQQDMQHQPPITIRVMLGFGGDEIAQFSCEPNTRIDELYQKVKALPSFPHYQDSSISNGNASWCISCCVSRYVTIQGKVYRISPWADIDSIQELQQVLDTHRAALPANALINIVNGNDIVLPSDRLISEMLTRSNIDNSATILVFKNGTAIQGFETQMQRERGALERLNREADEQCERCLETVCTTCIVTSLSLPLCYLCVEFMLLIGSC